ncbi:YhcG family protein [Mannheimia sp. ZY171111]|uniref:PDDEXK nuclease domain-containing protein n=1 Tax=Mannheimia sp. ZY171111 TaxID=2679995 RepID=UPI001ADD82B0|nr:PDDEXK nuclease domain-containing protein [Mannheimia sp. ZY171111]QTM00185.1 DUF1016 family protein [Mannheimia sp. ZY171111]
MAELQQHFGEIAGLIQTSRANALRAVNAELVNLYWNVGAYISQKLQHSEWGDKTVSELAKFLKQNEPDLKGFDRRGLYRMVQFYETYALEEFVSPVVTQLENSPETNIVSPVSRQFVPMDIRQTILGKVSWTNHLIIFTRCKIDVEREFYIRMSIKERYSKRELDRQISACQFERTMLGNTQLSPALKEFTQEIEPVFKDSYIFDFLNLPESHNESDLQKGLVSQMKNVILELGRDFLFMGQEYKLQVGNSDFFIDLLFYHRGLQCLVAFELKADKFRPEHLGQLNFYLEALDRDVKRENENPSIGILLCKDKDNEVVEYALNRNLSPAMVAEYQVLLPQKELLQRKLRELEI